MYAVFEKMLLEDGWVAEKELKRSLHAEDAKVPTLSTSADCFSPHLTRGAVGFRVSSRPHVGLFSRIRKTQLHPPMVSLSAIVPVPPGPQAFIGHGRLPNKGRQHVNSRAEAHLSLVHF